MIKISNGQRCMIILGKAKIIFEITSCSPSIVKILQAVNDSYWESRVGQTRDWLPDNDWIYLEGQDNLNGS